MKQVAHCEFGGGLSEISSNRLIIKLIKRNIRIPSGSPKEKPKGDKKKTSPTKSIFCGTFFIAFGDLDRHEKVTDRQKIVPYSYPRQNSLKRGTICRKMAKCCRDLATLHLSHYELIKVVL